MNCKNVEHNNYWEEKNIETFQLRNIREQKLTNNNREQKTIKHTNPIDNIGAKTRKNTQPTLDTTHYTNNQ